MEQSDRVSPELESRIENTFAVLRGQEHFSDVTLVSDDGQLAKAKTHKSHLSANSPLLDAILNVTYINDVCEVI